MSKGTHVIVQLVEELQDERWEAKIVEQNATRVKLSINSSAKAVIGKYTLSITTQYLKTGETSTHDQDKDIYMLFNPWCEGERCQFANIIYSYKTSKTHIVWLIVQIQ